MEKLRENNDKNITDKNLESTGKHGRYEIWIIYDI